jgi:hypothetical protein
MAESDHSSKKAGETPAMVNFNRHFSVNRLLAFLLARHWCNKPSILAIDVRWSECCPIGVALDKD